MTEVRQTYDDKLALILRTAAAVFAEKGYHDASIRDISRATSVSLSGLYYYFRSKEELLFLIQHHCFTTLVDNLERLLADETDAVRRFRLMVDNHLRFFIANKAEMKVLSHELDTLTGEFRTTVNEVKRRYVDACAGVLDEVVPVKAGINSRVAVFSLFGMMNWIYNWYHPGRDVPVDELVNQMSRLFLYGCTNENGGGSSTIRDELAADTNPSIWRT